MLRTENIRIHLETLGVTWSDLESPSVPHTWRHLEKEGVFPPLKGGNPLSLQVWSAEGRTPFAREVTR
jgi:hypothetical protein